MQTNTRLWLRGIIATIINGFASGVILVVADPVKFNLQEGASALFWTSAVFALMGLANYLKQHPLPDDDQTINPSRIAPLVLLALLLGSVGLTGCASANLKGTLTSPAAVATSVDDAGAKARAVADHALGILDAAGALLDQVIPVEKKVEPLMAPSQRTAARKALNAVNDGIEAAAKGIKAGVRSEEQVRDLLAPVLKAATDLQSLVASLPAPSQSRFGFSSLVSTLVTIAQSLFGAGEPAYAH